MIKADILYIGYPRSGSTYLRAYFRDHPQINYDDQQIAELLYQPNHKPVMIDKPPSKVYISCDESIAESVCIFGDPALWSRFLYRPGCFNLVRYDLTIDPNEAVRRMKQWFPNAKIMMVIREQVDWFSSLYKATITSLPPNQRTFHDYWITPQGIAMRAAGYHDLTIRAWRKAYDDVLVMRYEKLMESETSKCLCDWLGVNHMPFPEKRVNESHASVARLHRSFPLLSAMPHSVKAFLKPFTGWIPGKRRPVLSDAEKKMIYVQYMDSNKRTRELLGGL